MTEPTSPVERTAAIAPGVVGGAPRWILRAEAFAVLAAASALYSSTGASWWLFAGLFFLPDVSMLGYCFNRRIGARVYNFGHSYLGPCALLGLGLTANAAVTQALALIWIAHIGFDRAVGYGLKYPSHFTDTHLGLPFQRRQQASARGLTPRLA